MSSIKSRKVSTQSLRSECSDGESVEADSAGVLSDDNQDSPDNTETQDEQDYSKFMPWIKVSQSGFCFWDATFPTFL